MKLRPGEHPWIVTTAKKVTEAAEACRAHWKVDESAQVKMGADVDRGIEPATQLKT